MKLKWRIILGILGLGVCWYLAIIARIIPSPRSWSRQHVQNSDYEAMAVMFGGPLPSSFKLIATKYYGYSHIFNGPDGPAYSSYWAQIRPEDVNKLLRNTRFEAFEKGKEPVRLRSVAYEFSKSVDAIFDHPELFNGYAIHTGTLYSMMLEDRRSSETIDLYISTQVPYVNPGKLKASQKE